MSRASSRSLQLLKTYISVFSLKSLLEDDDYESNLAILNNKLIGLNFTALSLIRIGVLPDPESRVKEVLSDLNSCLMMQIIGNYKLLRVSQRLAIENFLRIYMTHVIGDSNPYERIRDLRDAICKSSYYLTDPKINRELASLISSYSNLSLYVHSVTTNHLAKTSHLSNFPRKNKKEMNICSRSISNDMSSMIYILCAIYKTEFKLLHFSERETILDSLSPTMAREITS